MDIQLMININTEDKQGMAHLLNALVGMSGLHVVNTGASAPAPAEPVKQVINSEELAQTVKDNIVPLHKAPTALPTSSAIQQLPQQTALPVSTQQPPTVPALPADISHEAIGKAAAAYLDANPALRPQFIAALTQMGVKAITQLPDAAARVKFAEMIRQMGAKI